MSKRTKAAGCVIALDVETTGFSPLRGDRVIEIGAVAFDKSGFVGEFTSLINVDKRIPASAQLVHGITNEMLIGQPGPEKVFPLLRSFVSDSVLVAHNASFDMGFLRHEFSRLGMALDNEYHCTLDVCRRRLPRLSNHRLETVCRHLFGKQVEGVRLHRALDDARMVARVWMEMMEK